MATLFEAYVTNAGKYADYGVQVGEPLKFPTTTEEVQALLKRIGVDGVRYKEIFIQCLFRLGNMGRIEITPKHIICNPSPHICDDSVWLVMGKAIVDRNLYVIILSIYRKQCKTEIVILLYINFAGECDLLFHDNRPLCYISLPYF